MEVGLEDRGSIKMGISQVFPEFQRGERANMPGKGSMGQGAD